MSSSEVKLAFFDTSQNSTKNTIIHSLIARKTKIEKVFLVYIICVVVRSIARLSTHRT